MRALLALFALLASPALAGTITINWNAVTQYVDGTTIPTTVTVTYNVYGASCTAGTPCTLSIVQSADRYSSAVISNVAPGYYCYAITAVPSIGLESAQSSPPSCVTVAAPAAKAPVVTSAVVGP